MSDDLSTMDATALAELVRRGEASPRELVDAAIERIERLNPKVNAVIHRLYEKARARADGEIPEGPFRGVPFLLKDLDVYSAGDPFHAGMRHLKERDWRPSHDSYLFQKFERAGFVTVGKTNTPELGLTVTTEPEAYGPSRNPWSLEHSTGGSSGGAGAAVACGMVPVAHASDGGGSIRIPASECGLVGLKPSRGRISLGPDHGEYWAGFVTSNVVTRSVRDTARTLDAIAGPMPGDPYAAPQPLRPYAEELEPTPTRRLRVGITRTSFGEPLHADCLAAVDRVAKALESLGHVVEESHPAALDEMETRVNFFTVVTVWVAAALDGWAETSGDPIGPDGVEPATWAAAEAGRAVSAAAYVRACDELDRFSRRMASWWEEGFDLLVTPTLAGPPPKIGELAASPDNPLAGTEKVLALIPFTTPFNATGQPAMSLPVHWNGAELPIGVQLIAAYGREDLLISAAADLERETPWADRIPPVHASR